MKKIALIIILLVATLWGYSQTQIIYSQNFETWVNGAPTNWGGTTTNIASGNTTANQYLTNPTNTSAKFFGNTSGVTYVTTPYFSI